MEPLTSLDASPELIWGFGIVILGITLALTMFYAKHLNARQRALRNNATRRTCAQDDAEE